MNPVVNGPGESMEADIGIAGGKGEGLVYKKGKPIGKVPGGQDARVLDGRDRADMKMSKTSKIVEKRKFPRFPLSINSRAHVRNEVGSRVLTFACEVVNVSEGGLMLTAREPFMAVGQTVVVEIDFEGGLELHGRVRGVAPVEVELSEDNLEKSVIRWIDKKNGKFGVEFVGLDSKRREKLTALISRLRGASLKSSED